MNLPADDRRLTRRVPLSMPLRVRVWKSAIPEQRAESLNISERGVYFATGSHFKEGEQLELFLRMPEEIVGRALTDWRCVGHVVRVQALDASSRSLGVAVQFDRYQVLPERELAARVRTRASLRSGRR
jgi:hypothetical protein